MEDDDFNGLKEFYEEVRSRRQREGVDLPELTEQDKVKLWVEDAKIKLEQKNSPSVMTDEECLSYCREIFVLSWCDDNDRAKALVNDLCEQMTESRVDSIEQKALLLAALEESGILFLTDHEFYSKVFDVSLNHRRDTEDMVDSISMADKLGQKVFGKESGASMKLLSLMGKICLKERIDAQEQQKKGRFYVSDFGLSSVVDRIGYHVGQDKTKVDGAEGFLREISVDRKSLLALHEGIESYPRLGDFFRRLGEKVEQARTAIYHEKMMAMNVFKVVGDGAKQGKARAKSEGLSK